MRAEPKWQTSRLGSQKNTNPRLDEILDSANNNFKAAITYKELEENVFKNFKEHLLSNVWTEYLSRKIQSMNKKEILKVKNIITIWKFYWMDLTANWKWQKKISKLENRSIDITQSKEIEKTEEKWRTILNVLTHT